MSFSYRHEGFCPCCNSSVVFSTSHPWFRDSLVCPACGASVRERAVTLTLKELFPSFADLSIHESSPAARDFSRRIDRDARKYIPTHYFPGEPLGTIVRGFRNENLEAQTFPDETFDVVISLDVMEHVFRPDRAYAEICRTLRPGGYYVHTFPIMKWQLEAYKPRALLGDSGEIQHLVEPAYHGNPVDEKGALVTFDYGYDIVSKIAEWAPFDVRITRFCSHTHGILGEYTEVVVCRKIKAS